jgi:tetratricopeptide (TPR) repeat protein
MSMTAPRRLGPARDRGADVDAHALGERLRHLRAERGMTLNQVADGRFSAAFLSQIERGLARPSPANLGHIAERLEVDLETLLRTTPREVDREIAELRLTEARAAVIRDEPARALKVLASLPASLTDLDRLDAGLIRADALVRSGEYDKGMAALRTAAEMRGADTAEARVRVAEIACRAHYRRQRYHQALDALREAQGIVGDAAIDPMTRSRFLCARGMCQFMLGNEQAAISDYEAALDASGNLTDLSELGRIYDALNIAHQSLGNLAEALTYARKSAQIFEVLQNGRSVGQTHHNMGELLVRQGNHEEAVAAFERALGAFRSVDALGPQAYALHSLAGIALQRGDLDQAERLAADAAAIAERCDDRTTQGDVAQLRGLVAVERGDLVGAEQHLADAIAAFDEVGIGRRLADACFQMGALLQRRGEESRALTFALRAYSTSREVRLDR